MSTTKHTQSQLHTGGDGTVLYAEDGFAVANAAVFQGRQEPGESKENARRLVACWNACDGISTENLEDNLPVKWLVRQYNETLSALRQIANGYTGALEPEEVESHLRQIARAALDKIKAEGGVAC